ncbi:hypothetical protein SAMN04487897_106100 [Paenibacillus sp. yr247]|nr:hypothetical protein SAMN04487897_106100 [Paenibacillus sp. yr247]
MDLTNCGNRLRDYNVIVLDQNQVWSNHQTTYPNPNLTVSAGGLTGRYVKIQLMGTNSLALAEVQVFGELKGAKIRNFCRMGNFVLYVLTL